MSPQESAIIDALEAEYAEALKEERAAWSAYVEARARTQYVLGQLERANDAAHGLVEV